MAGCTFVPKITKYKKKDRTTSAGQKPTFNQSVVESIKYAEK